MRPVKISDEELLKGLVSNNKAVLLQYYTLFFRSTRRLVLLNSGNEEDARDIFQEVLLVLYQKARRADFVLTCALGTYLYSVSRFLWLKELTKRKRESSGFMDEEEFVDPDADVSALNEQNERWLIFRKHFDELSEDCQRVLSMFNDGYSIAEITATLGYSSEQHTRNRRYRCKMSLMERIKKELGLEEESYGNYKDD